MITIEKIKKEFEYIPEKYNKGFYSGNWEFESQHKNPELYFISNNENVSHEQIKNFNHFITKKDEISILAQNFISKDLKNIKYKNFKNFLSGNFEFDIITVYGENNESDIEIICSKYYKKLFWNKRIDYIIFMKDFKVAKIIKFGA